MFERVFVEANKWAIVAILATMACIVFANVSLRYLTNFSITWAEEVARYLMIWMTFLGAGLALRQGSHAAIGNLQELLGPKFGRLLRVVVVLLLLVFCALMAWTGYEYMTRMSRQVTPATRVSFGYIYAAMPVGFLLFIVHLLLVARRYLGSGAFDEAQADDAGAAAG